MTRHLARNAPTGRRANKAEKRVNGKIVKPVSVPRTIRLLVRARELVAGVLFLRRFLALARN